MNSPDSFLDCTPDPIAQTLLLELKSRTRSVLAGTLHLLQGGAIKDEIDRAILSEAATFIETPTESLEEIKSHTTAMGQVLAGYVMQGEDTPPAINVLDAYLWTLQCINRIQFVEEALEREGAYSPDIAQAMLFAFDWATMLLSGHKNHAPFDAVKELQERLKNL
ncbi:MAG: hypothetical protein ACD_28C00003G0003 [uncultured bacterium]|nr:MAG: hypothetical protein ACD_28C00003G0003 [uncultured bacterium]KKT73058.1 MAG: hypothetical protein UW70_C0092G0008 [Candidatus Peregrinibacteria bacterium GW2011_GWA2_44_7]